MSFHSWKALAIAVFAAAAAAAFPGARPTSAQAPSAASKLDPHLAALLTAVRDHRPAARLLRSYWRPGDLRGGALTVEIVAARGSAPVRSVVRRLGGRVTTAYAGLVEASVPLRGLDTLAQSRSVRMVRPPIRFWPAAVSEGVATTAARAWQRAGRNGRGVKIAVVDGGFTGYRAREQAGDLARDTKTRNFCGSAGFSGPSVSQHGTAVAEIVHDMAPQAQLFLVCADTTPAVKSAASYALAHGVRIVNFSQGTYFARGDGTGALDTIVRTSTGKGLLWVVAAGNAGDGHWRGTFADSNRNGRLDFAPGVEELPIAVPGGVEACVDLRWDNWPLSNQDYDLVVLNDAGHQVNTGGSVRQGALARTDSQLRRVLEARVVDRGAAGVDDDYGAGSLALGAPLRLRDLLAPAVTALPTHGRVGGPVALRFRSSDPDSSLVRI